MTVNVPASKFPDAGPKPTAYKVATLRAAHQLLDSPLVLDDPVALTILGPANEAALRANIDLYNDAMSRGLRTSLVVRSRFAEDEWHLSEQNGVQQYVILGAGLDTYPYRASGNNGPRPQTARIFEVDFPDTQVWKRQCLASAGIPIPANLTYAPVDFAASTLRQGLAEAGFDQHAPAFFSWLGVAYYLDEETVMNTLRYVASCAKGSAIVFDYAVLASLLGPVEREKLALVTANCAAAGEPWQSFFDPAGFTSALQELGFSSATSYSIPQLHQRFLTGRTDGLQVGGLCQIMHAVV
jgi:methyltransferase (TIGR00027 family)